MLTAVFQLSFVDVVARGRVWNVQRWQICPTFLVSGTLLRCFRLNVPA